MKVEVLVATMHQKDHSIVEKMNIRTDSVIANQCDKSSYQEFISEYGTSKIVSTNTKGVGVNRNFALLYATKEIILFADDDLKYEDSYDKLILEAFKNNPHADVIIFNLNCAKRTKIKKTTRVKWYNYMRYGAVRIAMKLDSQRKANIWFTTLFGGGAKHGSGEDTLFLHDCLAKGLKVYAVPTTIATLTEERPSTWFNGYNEKYFYDKGALYASVSKRWAKLLCLQDLLRHKKIWKELGFVVAYKEMLKGIKSIRKI